MKRVLASPQHAIEIRSPQYLKGSLGKFDYTRNTIQIAWNRELTDSDIRVISQNEYSHASICSKRKKKTKACLKPPQHKKLNKILIQGYNKIADYEKLFSEYLQRDAKNPGDELKQLFSAMIGYDPKLVYLNLSQQDLDISFKRGAKKLSDGLLYFPKGALLGTLGEAEFWAKKNNDMLGYRVMYAREDNILAKTKTFFMDMKAGKEMHKEKSADSFFKSSDFAGEIAEYISDVENLTPGLKKLFFPGFCEIFSKFHQVEDYCERPVLSS